MTAVPAAYAQVEEDEAYGGGSDNESGGLVLKSEFDDDEEDSEGVADDESDIIVVRDEYGKGYVETTVQNWSKLMWKLRALDINDDENIDNFLLINECDIYETFIKDDFEWAEIREAAREMIKRETKNFPRKFKFMMALDLGRYDREKGGFPVISGTAFRNVRKVAITGNSVSDDLGCNRDGRGSGRVYTDLGRYPRNVIMILNKPFSYDFVKTKPETAEAFLLRRKYSPVESFPDGITESALGRIVYARLRVSFSQYQGDMMGTNGGKLAILYGKLDGIDIFEDMNEENLLSSTSYLMKKPKRVRKKIYKGAKKGSSSDNDAVSSNEDVSDKQEKEREEQQREQQHKDWEENGILSE